MLEANHGPVSSKKVGTANGTIPSSAALVPSRRETSLADNEMSQTIDFTPLLLTTRRRHSTEE
jgi:hypothetical protein